MTISVRAACEREYPILRDIFARAFKTDDEARLWDYLVEHDPSLRPEGVRVAIADGRPVACTVVLPRLIRTRRGWTPGAVVTLVACLPDLQGKGYGGATVHGAVSWIEQQGLALGILYGHPGYYPRFGFVPVLPSALTQFPSTAFGGEESALGPAADLEALVRMYQQSSGAYLCAVARSADPWLWRPRNEGAVLAFPDGAGYAFATPGKGALRIHEAAGDPRRLAGALCAEARRAGLETVELAVPPDHPLAQFALTVPGARQEKRPAAAGMAVITNWQAVLPEGYRLEDGALLYGPRRMAAVGPEALTQLALGYRTVDELALAASAADLEQLRRDFPAATPKWSLAPFWH